MSGFIVLPRESGQPIEQVEARYAACLEVFSKKGLALDRRFEGERFLTYRYNKLIRSHDAWVEFPDGDFAFSTGTFIYDGKLGSEALRRFLADYAENKPFEHKCLGNFSLVIYRKGTLSILADYCGYYPVYRHDTTQAVSSSFLALASLGNNRKIDPQAMYEYLLHGFFVGEETLLEGIHRLDSRKLWQISPALKNVPRTASYELLPNSLKLDEIVEAISGKLRDYFKLLSGLFPGDIGSALSGGYDSRHMAALMLSVGEKPHLYVYGGSNSSDVRVALNVAQGEGLEIEHTDKSAMPKASPENFSTNIERDFYFFDGIKPLGQIDDGSDMTTRLYRANKARLQLNGAGGEIYREIWNLADRNIDLETFLKLRYDRSEYGYLKPPFNSQAYFIRFADKVRRKLAIDRPQITRKEAEMLFPFLRNHFASSNNQANSQISDSLLPFMETGFVYPSFDIPIRYKYCGKVHAQLIRRAWPSLAGYQSDYGINFADPIPAKYRLRRMIDRHIPFAVRMLARKHKPRMVAGKPYYLSEGYLESVFDLKSMAVEEYVNLSRLNDPELLSRALSVELLLKHLH
jgi:hypothetical protein